MTPRPAHKTRRTCACGRTFAKYHGLEVHERTCTVEAERREQWAKDFDARCQARGV